MAHLNSASTSPCFEPREELPRLRARIAELENRQTVLMSEVEGIAKMGLTPQNQWDHSACHNELTLSGRPKQLIVQHTGDWKWLSVFAVLPIPKFEFGKFYFEIKVLGTLNERILCIGLGKNKSSFGDVRYYEGAYVYESSGKFWGHEVEGCTRKDGRPYINGTSFPDLDSGDVVGCGVLLGNRQIFYTKNGERLGAGLHEISFRAMETRWRNASFICPSIISPSPSIVDSKAKAAGQVADYLNSALFDGSSAAFWRSPMNSAKYSLILPLVLKYHSATMGTMEVERFFSTATFLLNDLHMTDLFVEDGELFPCVSLFSSHMKIETNFGPFQKSVQLKKVVGVMNTMHGMAPTLIGRI
uniref:B30.2/SPRY domain-containing protein n=1 Tax=Globodera rostochiensis TaxID=31243 RepID=A0A914HJ37_GLORO